ncbi:MAG: hypothetical protein JST31_04335, partial [Actinobacteria bacterium]|nr:hypothetical protein [Actinomycetota bacterium]
MSRLARSAVAVTVLATLAITVGGRALAYFSGDGTGSASAAVTSLQSTTISAATAAAGGTVSLSWEAVTPPGAGTVSYYVTRDGGAAAGNCPTAAAPTAVTSCQDSGVAVGEHSYRVVAVWHAWTATSAPVTATVAVGEAVKFTITGSTTTPATGAAVNLTITARDAANNTVTSYTGSHNLVFAGASPSPEGKAATVLNGAGAAVEFGNPTALTFSAGVAAV